MTAIRFQPNPSPSPLPDFEGLPFGRRFTDHMFLCEWTRPDGWENPRVVPYGSVPLDPAAAVLHYAQEVFDGFKAFRGADGKVRLFRLADHARRMADSARRLSLPEIPGELFTDGVKALVHADSRWVPPVEGTSLYIRTNLFATEGFLGVRPADRCLFSIIASPSGPYFSGGRMTPLRLKAEGRYTRAAPGGLGAAKTAANYAASLLAAEEAKKSGCDQVLWLDNREHRFLEEAGTMNLFVVLDGEIVTPPLTGTILPGVTRASAIRLMRRMELNVTERPVSLDELRRASASGTLRELFGTGTAASVAPVGELVTDEGPIRFPDAPGPVALRLFRELTAIQYGHAPDTEGWLTEV